VNDTDAVNEVKPMAHVPGNGTQNVTAKSCLTCPVQADRQICPGVGHDDVVQFFEPGTRPDHETVQQAGEVFTRLNLLKHIYFLCDILNGRDFP
jgi:hypothetical protein